MYVSKCTEPDSFVRNGKPIPLHVEKRDIRSCYVIYLGDFQGAWLEVFDSSGERLLGKFAEPYKFAQFEPRNPHRLVRSIDFSGARYALVFFKSYDSRLEKPAPLLEHPHFLESD